MCVRSIPVEGPSWTEKSRLSLECGPALGQACSAFAANPLSLAPAMASDPAAAQHPCAAVGHAPPVMSWQTHAYQDVNEFMTMLGVDLQMMGPGSGPPHQGEGTAMLLSDADLESVTSWDQVETEPKPTGTAFDMMSQPSAVDHYECDHIMLGLLEGLRQSNTQCQSAATFTPETSPWQGGSSSSSNQLMKSNRAARQHLDFFLTRRCRVACLARLDSTYLVRTIFAWILTRYEDAFGSITEYPPASGPCIPEGSKDGKNTGHVRSGAVFFEPAQFEDFSLGREGEIRINIELLLCELQAFESALARVGNTKAEHHSEQAGYGELDVERSCANSSLSAEAVFEALMRERMYGLMKRVKTFRDSLA